MQHLPRPRPRAASIAPAALVVAGSIGLAVLTAVPAQAAPTATTVSISTPTSVTVGSPVDVDVTIPDTADVYAYDVTLAVDGDLVAYRDGSVTGPDGGHDAVRTGDGGDTLHVLHTRLGSSPALDGDLAASVTLDTLAAGTTEVTVTSVEFVGSDGSTTTLTDPASTSVTIAAVATPTPSPTAAVPGPGADPSGPATAEPSDPATAIAVGDADDASGASRPTGDALAWTGADVLPWAAVALALLVAGTTLITVRARRARREQTGDAA
uniref:Cohesin domain-containing protein n=1 Tax=Neobacillus citreus TaxID=2833578 RepID=A0A942SZN2_9BACI